jgi:hypothetical protein
MKIWTIALSTFGSLVRNRLLIVFGVLFVCTVLLMMTPLLGAKAIAKMGQSTTSGGDGDGNGFRDHVFRTWDGELAGSLVRGGCGGQ